MIDPINLIKIEDLDNSDKLFKLTELPDYDTEDYDLNSGKDFNKYISDLEKIVRGSYEYKALINHLRNYYEMNKSASFQSLSNTDSRVRIEIHHSPFTLYDICRIVYDKRSFYHQDLSIEMVAKEVMELHYRRVVGLVPVTETEHQLVHNQYYFIPTTILWGRYDLFVSMYNQFLEEYKSVLEEIEEYSKVYDQIQQNKIISKSSVYIDPNGAYELPKLEDLKSVLSDRISLIKNNNYMLPSVDTKPVPAIRFIENGEVA